MENKAVKSFRDLKVWQKSADLAVDIYLCTENFPKSELYGITSQMRRAVVSISSNIAEGFKRSHGKEKTQFYYIAYGSTTELESQIEISYKLKMLTKEAYDKLLIQIIEVSKMLDGLIKSTIQRGHDQHIPKSYILNTIFSTVVFLYSIFYILTPSYSLAANISFESPEKVGVNQDFQVDVMLDTEMENINALEGKIIFDSSKLALKEVRDPNTVVSLWVKNPADSKSAGMVEFSGITPGGYNSFGRSARVFSLIFNANQEGSVKLQTEEISVLLHDGQGSPARVTIAGAASIIIQQGFVSTNPVETVVDNEAPEPPFVEIIRDVTIEKGDWVAVFYAHDKKSGIDHYEIAEDKGSQVSDYQKLSWQKAQSPQRIADQTRQSFVYLKAIDRAGNEIVTVVPPLDAKKLYENIWFWCIIILALLLLYFGGIVWRKQKRSVRYLKR